MKILSASQQREADAYTIAHEPIPSIRLMERAAQACVQRMLDKDRPLWSGRPEIHVVCGMGNNGGDGLAIARMLAARKYKIQVWLIRHAEKASADFKQNEKRLKSIKSVKVKWVHSASELPSALVEGAVVIDALFGSGLNRPAEALAASAIQWMNRSGRKVISVDLPSGLSADSPIAPGTPVVQASHTLTFQSPKLSFLLPSSGNFAGNFSILDIGLHPDYISGVPCRNHFLLRKEVALMKRHRSGFSHKGSYGHALMVAGSLGMMGAAVLSSRSCLTAGAGLVTARIPRCGYTVLQTANPEVMVEVDESETMLSGKIDTSRYDAIGIGPGLGTAEETARSFKLLIQEYKRPMVIDADAINILAENKTWLAFLPPNSVLTPHPGEFRRLAGEWENDLQRLELQREMAQRFGVYIVLKGAHSSIACPDGTVYFNSTGNPGMATAGSGDVLTGMLTGLLAQGYDPKEASLLGVYLHGLAGDLAREEHGEEAMIARNIIENIGKAYWGLKN